MGAAAQAQRFGDGSRRDRSQALEPPANDLRQGLLRCGHCRLEQRASFGRHPQIPARGPANACHPALCRELVHERRPRGIAAAFLLGQEREPRQRVVQFVGRRGIRPGLVANPGDRFAVEPAEVGGGGWIDPAAAHHGLGAALLQRRIVKIRIGARGQRLERQRRGLGQVARDHSHRAAFEPAQQHSRTHPTSIASSRQSRMVWRTSG